MGMKKLGFRFLLVLIVAVVVVQLKPNCANAGYIDSSFRILGMTVDDFNRRQANSNNQIFYPRAGFVVPYKTFLTPFKQVPGIKWYPDCHDDPYDFYAVDTNTNEIVGYFKSLTSFYGTPARTYLARFGDAFFDVSPDNVGNVFYWNLNNGRLMVVINGGSYNDETFNFYDYNFVDGIVVVKEGYDCLVGVSFPDRYVLEELQENINRERAEREAKAQAEAEAKAETERKDAELQVSQALLADPYIEQGLKLHAEKKYEEGDKAFEKAIELAPKYDKAYAAYIKAYIEKKEWKKIYEITGRAINEAGIEDNMEIRYYRGFSAYRIVDPYRSFVHIARDARKDAQMLKIARKNLDYVRLNCTDSQMKKDAEKWYSKTVAAIQKWYAYY